MATNYRRGADFERKVMRDLEAHGYCVVRSAGSHSPADLIALRRAAIGASADGAYIATCPEVVAVQCKRNGRLDPEEWNEFWEWCLKACAKPILASRGANGRAIIYSTLTSRKDGKGRQPLESWTPQSEGSTDEVS